MDNLFEQMLAQHDFPFQEGVAEEAIGDDDIEVLWAHIELTHTEDAFERHAYERTPGYSQEYYWETTNCADCLWQASQVHIQVARNDGPAYALTLEGVSRADVRQGFLTACAHA